MHISGSVISVIIPTNDVSIRLQPTRIADDLFLLQRHVIVTGRLILEQLPFELEPERIDEGWPQHFDEMEIFTVHGERLRCSNEVRAEYEAKAIQTLRYSGVIPDSDASFLNLGRP